MEKPTHVRMSDLRGIQRLANDAVVELTDLVEAMHHTIASATLPLGPPPEGRTRGITGFAYRSVRGATRLVGAGLDAILAAVEAMPGERASSEQRDAVLAALNGIFGDHLADTRSPLAIDMRIASPVADGAKLVVLVHGLCMNDRQWRRAGHDHGEALARDLGYAPLYLRYNTGRHISTNGREFAELMEATLRARAQPVGRLAIVGHSMGGLVARSACHYGALAGHAWVKRLDDLVFLGTPHLGAPLERAGAMVDLLVQASPYSAPFARLGRARSAGIRDLSHGHLRDEDWQHGGPAHVPLPARVRCHAVAASLQQRPAARAVRIRGDGLVPVASALGDHPASGRGLRIPAGHRWVAHGMGHFDLLSRAEVYERLRGWLGEPSRRVVKESR